MRKFLRAVVKVLVSPHVVTVEKQLAVRLAPIVLKRIAASGAIGAALAGVLVDLFVK